MAIEAKNDTLTYLNSAGERREAQLTVAANPDGSSQAATSGVVASSVTRPADTNAYSIGDLIANSTTAGSVVPLSFAIARANDRPIRGRRIRVKASTAGWKAAVVRVHLFRDAPTVTVGDNGALNNSETYAFTESDYLGYADVTLAQLTSDNIAKGFATIDVTALPHSGSTTIYGLLEARTAVTTPASGTVLTATLEAGRD